MATSHHQPVIVCLGKSSFSIAKSSHHSWAMFNRFLLSHWRVKTNIPGLGISNVLEYHWQMPVGWWLLACYRQKLVESGLFHYQTWTSEEHERILDWLKGLRKNGNLSPRIPQMIDVLLGKNISKKPRGYKKLFRLHPWPCMFQEYNLVYWNFHSKHPFIVLIKQIVDTIMFCCS